MTNRISGQPSSPVGCFEAPIVSYEDWHTEVRSLLGAAPVYSRAYVAQRLSRMIQDYPDYAARAGIALPEGASDPASRKTYRCQEPLFDHPGAGRKNGPDGLAANRLYHQYSCVEKEGGEFHCEGQGAGNLTRKGVQGEVTADEYHPERCDLVSDKKDYADCIEDQWAEGRPYYWYSVSSPNGKVENCQAYDERIHQECQKKVL